jgi:hypothetical protein
MNRQRFIPLACWARGGDVPEIVVFAATSLRDSNKKGKP